MKELLDLMKKEIGVKDFFVPSQDDLIFIENLEAIVKEIEEGYKH